MLYLVLAIASVLFIVFFLKNESDKSRAFRQGREEVISKEYPYILKGFDDVYDSHYREHNFKELEEAKREAQRLVTKIRIDKKVECERAEIWHQRELVQIFTTSHRISIENIDGFSIRLYNGEIRNDNIIDIDISQIESYKSMIIRLTNGEEHSVEHPRYSIQENSLRGLFMTYLKKGSQNKSQDYRCFPINIIDEVLNYKVKRQ